MCVGYRILQMFEGTDLSQAFGSVYEQSTPVQQMAPPPAAAPELPLPKSTTPHQTPPDMPFTPAAAMFAQQGGKPVTPPQMYEDSFFDKLGRKKWEVVKLVILSLVVLLGISMDKVVNHYLTVYISKSFLTDTQEFFVRIGYPISIVIVLWVIKSMM